MKGVVGYCHAHSDEETRLDEHVSLAQGFDARSAAEDFPSRFFVCTADE